MSDARPVAPDLFVAASDGARLLAGRCRSCARHHFPASPVCPYCGADGAAAEPVGPTGRLWLWTVVTTRPPGYRGTLPYGFGVVELDRIGLRVVTRLTETRLGHLHAGQPMRLVVETLCADDDGTPVEAWAFAPEGEA
ncbi:MAG: OB-fold domain-containing protein [bacterium]|nr:OB-fold domain-containing protein [bacterium]